MPTFLTHDSLKRVLQSLIVSTYRPQHLSSERDPGVAGPWSENLSLVGSGHNALGCDSLDLLHISAAVNEMFHLYEAGLETELLRNTSFGAWLDIVRQAWQSGVEHITVTTSGSTSSPKRCTHALSSLAMEIDFLAGLFGQRSRIVSFTPAHHLYGLLFTGMLPDRIAAPVQDLLRGADFAVSSGQVRLQPGDLVVSFPQGWDWIDRSFRVIPANVEGVVSTAPCPLELIESLVPHKLSALTEVYGSSETSGIGTRRWPAKSYSLMPQWTRNSSGDSEPEQLQHQAGFRVEPMDHLEFASDDTFLVRGRTDLGVQVGGRNVFPERIAEKLRTHAGVAEASVRLMRPEEGNRLKCFIVPQAGHSAEVLSAQLSQWIESWPVVAERPKTIRFGPALLRSSLGKNSDWG